MFIASGVVTMVDPGPPCQVEVFDPDSSEHVPFGEVTPEQCQVFSDAKAGGKTVDDDWTGGTPNTVNSVVMNP